jgi:uncharacterized protein (DUF1800 family)
MPLSRRSFLQWSAAGAAALPLSASTAASTGAPTAPEAARQLASSDPILHLMNRITWGVRADELARARQMGYDAYLDAQLNPESITDTTAETVLGRYPIVGMDRQTLYRLHNAYERPRLSMIAAMVERVVLSACQLQERMVDFWADHFNVSLDAEQEGFLDQVVFQREVLRQHALGNFRDMLFASAKSPAMLYYLDNFINIAEDPNENYARELLELHTLGVDGGYTEQDVEAVARAFTGWTVHSATRDGFYFNPETHDADRKQVLGHTLPAGRGIEDGLHVLSILANHPATAHFLSHKLCVRFVSDNPPQALVNSTAQVWQQSNGDIRTVLRHIFTSSAFRESAGQKYRRPLEWFIGALRATNTTFTSTYSLLELLERLSQVPYGWRPPDGYPDTAVRWMSTNNLLERWNIAMLLTHAANSHEHGMQANLIARIGVPQTVGELVDATAIQVFGTTLNPEQRAPFIAYVSDNSTAETPITTSTLAQKLATLYGLMLAAPLYQWR